MKVLERRSLGSFTRNQKPEFRRPSFATRLLLSVLATLIALEPTALAQQGAQYLPRGHTPSPQARFIVQVNTTGEMPADGYLDRFHTAKDAFANSRMDDVRSPNVSSLMYALRNTAVQGSLERQLGIRYLIGGERRAAARFRDLREYYFEKGWFGATGLFDGHEYSPDFSLAPSVKALYVGSKGVSPAPAITEYIGWLENGLNDPTISELDIREIRKKMVPALIERALAMIAADGELKYYTADYLQDYRVRNQFVRPYVAEKLKNRTRQPSPWELAKIGDMEAIQAETEAIIQYRKLSVDPDPKDENGKTIEFSIAPLLQGSRMEIAAILAFRQSIGDNPLLVAPVKGKPLYQLIHELVSSLPLKDPDTGGELKMPDPKLSWVPRDAKLPKRGEKIPPPIAFTTQLEKVRRALGGDNIEQPYKQVVNSRVTMELFDNLIDSALLTYLFATKQLMNSVTQRVDWDGDLRTEWARLAESDTIYNRAVADYAYLYRAAAKRAPASQESSPYVMHVDFPAARKLLIPKIERRRQIQMWTTYTIDAIIVIAGLAVMIFQPESAPAIIRMGIFRAGWLFALELGAVAMTTAFIRYHESDFSRKIIRDCYLAVPSGPDDEVQEAARVAKSDYNVLMSTIIMLGALPAFKGLLVVYRAQRAASAAVRAEQLILKTQQLEKLEEDGTRIASSGRALLNQGKGSLARLRDVLYKTGLYLKLPKLWALLRSPVLGLRENLQLGGNFMAVFRSEMFADVGFQLFAEAVNRREEMLGKQFPQFFVDMVNGAVMTALMVVLAFKAPTLRGRPLPTDFTQPLREMDPQLVTQMGRGWNNKDRLAGFLLNSFRYCAVGYASGVTGGAITKTVEHWGQPMSNETMEEAFVELNRQGWFLCNFAWAWSQPRMQGQNVARRIMRDKAGVKIEWYTHDGWVVQPGKEHLGRDGMVFDPILAGKRFDRLVYPSNWTKTEIDAFMKKYMVPSFVSNFTSTMTWPWLARTAGVEKEQDWSNPVDEVPDAVYLKIVERLDPVGALFGPMAGEFPLAPLAKDNGEFVEPTESMQRTPPPPAAPARQQQQAAPPPPRPAAQAPVRARPQAKASAPPTGPSALSSLWAAPARKRKQQ